MIFLAFIYLCKCLIPYQISFVELIRIHSPICSVMKRVSLINLSHVISCNLPATWVGWNIADLVSTKSFFICMNIDELIALFAAISLANTQFYGGDIRRRKSLTHPDLWNPVNVWNIKVSLKYSVHFFRSWTDIFDVVQPIKSNHWSLNGILGFNILFIPSFSQTSKFFYSLEVSDWNLNY